ncbi:MAG: hypothetical protein MR424_13130 [Treponema sp.]|nr:hypothetical protein [Treponema sp.]MCI6891387.1 hypothetical protein [Treponema sp.]
MKNLSKILVLFLTAFMILGFISCKKDAEESANVVVANVVVAFKADSATIAGNGELILTFYDDGLLNGDRLMVRLRQLILAILQKMVKEN